MHFVKTKREYVIIINFILQSISSYLLIFSISLTHRLIVILFVDVLVTALVHSRRCLYIKRWLSRSYSSQTSGRMKKIAIFGATGMTGLCTVEAALKQGLEVRALMRDPSRMPEELLKQVEVVTGDVLVKEDVDKVVEGRDAIVVTLGTRNDLAPTTIMSDGLRNILSSMEKNNVKIVSVCLSTFLFYDKPKVPAMFHGINDDHERMLHLLQGTESLNWIAVMPPHIASTPSGEYSVEIGSSPGRAISKYDLGKFMIECLSNPDYYKQKCGLATKVPAP